MVRAHAGDQFAGERARSAAHVEHVQAGGHARVVREPRREGDRVPAHEPVVRVGAREERAHVPNQRAMRTEANDRFSAVTASDGAVNVPLGVGPVRKSTSTRPTRSSPNST